MKARVVITLILILTLAYLTFPLSAKESKDTGNVPGVFAKTKTKPVAGAEITKVKAVGGDSAGPAEKTQFDVILKSRIKTNNKGEFSVIIPPQQFNKLPDKFQLIMAIRPPDGWNGISTSKEVRVKVKKSAGPKFGFFLFWIEENGLKSNKGCFAVNAKSQN